MENGVGSYGVEGNERGEGGREGGGPVELAASEVLGGVSGLGRRGGGGE